MKKENRIRYPIDLYSERYNTAPLNPLWNVRLTQWYDDLGYIFLPLQTSLLARKVGRDRHTNGRRDFCWLRRWLDCDGISVLFSSATGFGLQSRYWDEYIQTNRNRGETLFLIDGCLVTLAILLFRTPRRQQPKGSHLSAQGMFALRWLAILFTSHQKQEKKDDLRQSKWWAFDAISTFSQRSSSLS